MLRAAVVLLLLLSVPSAAHAEKRIALLIGNKDYKARVGALVNPLNDVRVVGEALKAVGFEVLRPTQNASRAVMLRSIHDFAAKLKAAGSDAVGFLYYSGHGIASAGENYLIPVDVEEPSTLELNVQGVKHSEVLAILRSEAPKAAHYLVLDACRNTLQAAKGGKGFLPVRQQSGVLIAFAAEPGKTASDVGQGSGPYAAALAAELVKPGQSDLIMFHNVRVAVVEQTGGDQVPWTEDGIQRRKRVQFGVAEHKPPSPTPVLPAQPPPAWRLSEAGEAWGATKDTTNITALELFIVRYKDTYYADLARLRIEELKKQQVASPTAPTRKPTPAPPPAPAVSSTAQEEAKPAPPLAQRPAPTPQATPTINTAPQSGAKPTPPQPSPAPRCAGTEIVVAAMGRRCLQAGSGKTSWFRDCADCPEMVVVPSGHFVMGSPGHEPKRNSEHEDQVKVNIATPFAVGRFAVTRGEFAAFVNAASHTTDGGCYIWVDGQWEQQPDRSWRSPGYAHDDRHPVTCVNWIDAKAYVSWLSSKTGKPYRLLSEAEREYVTRAETTTPFWWGSSASARQANYDGNHTYASGSRGEFRQKTVKVDSFAANPWGIYNVHGNVWEWVEDCWNVRHTGNRGDGSARTSGDCGFRVLRGGSWLVAPKNLRSAHRGWFRPTNRYYTNGLRVARTLD